MIKSLKTLILSALAQSLWTLPAAAQGTPAAPSPTSAPTAESAPDSDDMELPAKPGAAANSPAPAATIAPASASPAHDTSASVNAAGSATSGASAPNNARTAGQPTPDTTPNVPSGKDDKSPAWLLGLRIGGYIQAEYQNSQLSEDQLQQGGTPLNQNRFLIRRARLQLDRDWLYARASLHLDANTVRGVNVGIRRAEAALLYRGDTEDVKAPPLVMFTAGIMDIPFGYELLEPTRERPFMERTLGGSALFPSDADAGIRLSGGISFFRYAIALMNGEPLDNNGFPRDPNAAKDVIGRFGFDVQPGAWSLGGGASFATGKGFHAGQDAGKNQLVWRDSNQDGVFQDGEIAAVPATGATPSKNFDRWVLGLDLEASVVTKLGRSKAYAEGFIAQNYDRGAVPADPVVTGIDVREAGAYVALLQDITQYGLLGFRAGFYDPNADLSETRQGRLLPYSQTIWTLSPLVGFTLRGTAKLLFQYDVILDKLGRDSRGVPADAKNNLATVRLQVEL